MISQLPKVGQNLRKLRNELGISLDEASKLTGVSKAMLGQIERGESSPTISTLWKISSGLRVNFTTLLDDCKKDLIFVKKEDAEVIIEEDGNMKLYSIFPYDSKSGMDIFIIDLEGGCSHNSLHKNVIEEIVLVVEGILNIQIEKEEFELKAGDSLKFDGSLKHTYKNIRKEKVVFHNIEIYK